MFVGFTLIFEIIAFMSLLWFQNKPNKIFEIPALITTKGKTFALNVRIIGIVYKMIKK